MTGEYKVQKSHEAYSRKQCKNNDSRTIHGGPLLLDVLVADGLTRSCCQGVIFDMRRQTAGLRITLANVGRLKT